MLWTTIRREIKDVTGWFIKKTSSSFNNTMLTSNYRIYWCQKWVKHFIRFIVKSLGSHETLDSEFSYCSLLCWRTEGVIDICNKSVLGCKSEQMTWLNKNTQLLFKYLSLRYYNAKYRTISYLHSNDITFIEMGVHWQCHEDDVFQNMSKLFIWTYDLQQNVSAQNGDHPLDVYDLFSVQTWQNKFLSRDWKKYVVFFRKWPILKRYLANY